MKKTAAFWIAAVVLWGVFSFGAEASWLIDPAEFHISAHGQLSCQDCHEGMLQGGLHPDPLKVNKKREDFFDPGLCISCHDGIPAELNRGIHGRKTITDPVKYQTCLRCHKSHYQMRLGENQMGEFDPHPPRTSQCGACHEPRSTLPPLSSEDEACMNCHGLPAAGEPKEADRISELCFHCHGTSGTSAQEITGERVPLIEEQAYRKVSHAGIACITCHPRSAQFRHSDQRVGDCRRCHPPHDEKKTHDAHLRVACGACHLASVRPVEDPETNQVLWKRETDPGRTSEIHQMIIGTDEESCKRCHFSGNPVGAAAMVLPAKGILCMPCHAATFSLGDTTTILALILFSAGFFLLVSTWLTGSIPGRKETGSVTKLLILSWGMFRTVFSKKIIPILKALFLDVLFQRRLYRQSRVRWLIHGLIFFPIFFRFLWGFTALLGSLWTPHWPIWFMLDKNAPATAFLFDLSGIILLSGLFLTWVRGLIKDTERLPGLPPQDRAALFLMGGIVVVGFILEGMRMAMTGWPDGSGYAFAGYLVSIPFSLVSGLTQGYGYLWYLHAILTGAFIAYLPFSRLLHIIMAPVVLTRGAATGHGHDGR
jgi:nitrate reductase gamma subunit